MVELFWQLGHFRSVSAGLTVVYGPLPYEAVRDAADRFDVEDFEHFLRCMRAMDVAYLQVQHARNKQPAQPRRT